VTVSTSEDSRRVAPERRRARNGGWPLAAIVALAVGLRVLAWHNAVQMTNDGVDFLWQAERLLEGDVHGALSHPYHPLYAMLTALLALATGDVLVAAVAVSIVAGVAIVLGVHALARLALPNRPDVAWGAALLAALHERTLILTSDVASDGLFLGLFLLSLALVLEAEQRRQFKLRMLLSGLLAGLAYLARPEALFLVGVALLWVLLGVARRTGRRGRPLPRPPIYLAGLGAFLAGLVVIAAPYVWAMHAISGGWGLSLKPSMAAAQLSGAPTWAPPPDAPIAGPGIGPREIDDELVETPRRRPSPAGAAPPAQGTAAARADGATSSADSARRTHEVLVATRDGLVHSAVELVRAIRLDVVVLALLGLPLFLRRRSGLVAVAATLMVGWVCLGTTQWVLSGYLARRHMLAPALLALPLAGAGLAWLWGAWRRPGLRRLGGRILVVLVLVAAGASGARTRHTNHLPRVQALHWAAEHTAPDQRIGVHRRKDGHDAQRDIFLVDLPCPEAQLLEALERWNVGLLVLDLDRVARHAPHWLDGALFVERERFGTGKDTVIVFERGSAGS
jgi:4-amino-4-deoxy-L-arabinose transferase-like glycosyltransferase